MSTTPRPVDTRTADLYRLMRLRAQLLCRLARIDTEINRIRRENGLPEI
jgi:hypothetical protein